jgi:hypothetical protein
MTMNLSGLDKAHDGTLLDPIAEQVLDACPDIASWAENMLFTPYDPTTNVGMWLHLGTVPDAWEIWEDRVIITLPDDEGVLTMWAYHRTDPALKPAGANLRFECLEPWRRWRLTFDGFCLKTPFQELITSLVHDGDKIRARVSLDIEMATPIWDAHTAGQSATGQGGMAEQQWATEHYEQLYFARGTVAWGNREIAFNGAGWRDHSRGPRSGASMSNWKGHVITGCLYPDSGRAWGLSRYWAPDGSVTLEGGYVVEDGVLRHTRVTGIPALSDLQVSGEKLPFSLEWDGGSLDLTAITKTGAYCTFGAGLPYGIADPGFAYALNWGTCEWESEQGIIYVERTDLQLP